MSRTVGINPPKTPCTTEARGMAKCTIPNVCKMPGPPAPFVPTPLPNIGKSNLSPKGYTTTVELEGQTVAIRGATFESIGDIASKGTGGGLISSNTQGPTKFITPGSMDVQMEGKGVQLLGEPMLNNCGPSGSPPNTGATMAGFDTFDSPQGDALKKIVCDCDKKVKQAPAGQPQKTCSQLGTEKHKCCDDAIKAPPKKEGIEGEQGFGTKKDGHPPLTKTRSQMFHEGGGKALRGTCWPDATITGSDNKKRFVDFKFRCPPNTPVRKKKKGGVSYFMTGPTPGLFPTWTIYKGGGSQLQKYKDVGAMNGVTKEPECMTTENCP
ncbi:hypothetical protein AWB79_04310 [Caballeronia hypogeia]|uniref:Uncharacterized protein n=1 Tax=Caballeronia hypogeia TaxID=1777140 RepID=A0A158BVC5_9BURK|nr:PAAR-like domain-containing protein [Caballeronia hypogeia]SAK74043.1 hypothetical protein AWB79_04310 [Caballeronia hypogeia]